MNRKDCLAILGMLYSDFGSEVYYEGRNKKSSLETLFDRPEFNNEILCYLRGLKLPYVFVRDILSGEYGSVFYHKIWGKNSKLLPKKYKKEDELQTFSLKGSSSTDTDSPLMALMNPSF